MRALATAGILMALATFGAACDGDDGGGSLTPISDAPLSGKVGGSDWTFVQGTTNAFLSDEDGFWAKARAEAYAGCGAEPFGGNTIILNIPVQPSDQPLSLSRNITFVVDGPDGPENLVATNGRIVVTEVTDSLVRGGLRATFDADNTVDGQFEIAICP